MPHRRHGHLMRRPELPAALATAAGIGLAVAVFLPWYATNLGPATEVGRASGWDATGMAKGVLALAVIWIVCAGLSLAEVSGSVQIDRRTVEGLGWLVALCATLSGCLVLFRLLRPPGPTPDFLSRDLGLYVGVAACVLGIVAGVAMASRRPARRPRYAPGLRDRRR